MTGDDAAGLQINKASASGLDPEAVHGVWTYDRDLVDRALLLLPSAERSD